MIDSKIMSAILESIIDPVVFCDTEHIIRYMNHTAVAKYNKKGQSNLVGKSIFDCHNEKSRQIILDIFAEFQNGEEERFLGVFKDQKVFMRVVRDEKRNVIGYYERYEKIEV